jgi:hypothetical protein
MTMPFKLSVPADHRFRGVVLDVTVKCAELAGGSPADGQALAQALSETVNGMAPDSQAQVELAFRPGRGGVEITATCEGRSSTFRRPDARCVSTIR